jgi:FkbM family methyltransferase
MRVVSHLQRSWAAIRLDAKLVGYRAGIVVRLVEAYNRRRPFGLPAVRLTLNVRVRGLSHPVCMRAGTSDLRVLHQIFGDEREYAPFDDTPLGTIADCGAYVGYSGLYFLTHHPTARVIAVEPDPDNAALCRRNLKPYADRATVIEAALWSQAGSVAIVRGEYRDGGAWATYVRPATGDGQQVVRAVDVPAILQLLGTESIDLLKVDIERGEVVVFGPGSRQWLPRVKNIAIELHDRECEDVFRASLDGFAFDLLTSGERMICRNLRPADPGARAPHVAAAAAGSR